MKKLHPFSVTIAGAVLLSMVCVYAGAATSAATMSLLAAVLFMTMGFLIGRTWTVYPWQISIIGSLPGWIFLLWRILSNSDQYTAAREASTFAFLPMISMLTLYFGVYLGRWVAARRRIGRTE